MPEKLSQSQNKNYSTVSVIIFEFSAFRLCISFYRLTQIKLIVIKTCYNWHALKRSQKKYIVKNFKTKWIVVANSCLAKSKYGTALDGPALVIFTGCFTYKMEIL